MVMTPGLYIKLMVALPILACVFGYLTYRFAQNDESFDDGRTRRNLLCYLLFHLLCLVLFVSLFMGCLVVFIEGVPYLKYHD